MTNPNPLGDNVYLGRQPIFKENLSVIGYELLFRTGLDTQDSIEDAEQATRDVLYNTFTQLGVNHVVGDHFAFINMPRQLMIDLPAIPSDQVVFELNKNIEPDKAIIDACKRIRDQGYQIALDDFCFQPKMIPLLEIAHYVKIDIQQYNAEELQDVVTKLRKYSVLLVAEKIETLAEFEHCKKMKFDFYQGFFLSKPQVITGKKSAADKLAVARLLAELRNPKNRIPEIEKIVSSDPKLSYKLMQVTNSAAFTKSYRIESLHQAILYLGTEKLREWATLLAITSVPSRSPELMLNAMIRAKMCERFAMDLGKTAEADRYFMVGLFSMLDLLLDQDLASLLEQVNLDSDTKKALLSKEGPMGDVLQDVLNYELAEWDLLKVEKIEAGTYRIAYLESINWAMDTVNAISA